MHSPPSLSSTRAPGATIHSEPPASRHYGKLLAWKCARPACELRCLRTQNIPEPLKWIKFHARKSLLWGPVLHAIGYRYRSEYNIQTIHTGPHISARVSLCPLEGGRFRFCENTRFFSGFDSGFSIPIG